MVHQSPIHFAYSLHLSVLLNAGSSNRPHSRLQLLLDLHYLFKPQIVIEVDGSQSPKIAATSSSTHPTHSSHPNLIRCLGDVAILFRSPNTGERLHGSSAVLHKLTFYTAHVMTAPLGLIRRIADEIRIKSMTEDGNLDHNEGGSIVIPEVDSSQPERGGDTETVPMRLKPRIEEIL